MEGANLECWHQHQVPTISNLEKYTLAKVKAPHEDVPVPWCGISDIYAMIIGIILLIPAIFCYIIALGLTLPTMLIGRLYIACLSKPKIRIERGCSFEFISTVLLILSLPLITLVVLYLLLLFIVIFPLSLIYSILSMNIMNIGKNWQLLKPYRVHWFWFWDDIVCSVLGAMYRQGFFEFYPVFPSLLFITPILKYVFTCNPLLYNLEEKYINQWTAPLQLTKDEAISGLISNVCYGLHCPKQRKAIDEARFSAHYQFPPPNRENLRVNGLQFIGSVLNFTHTIHNVENIKVRSTTSSRGIFTVPLLFWNPFHILTGYVEVNLRADNIAFEHPMWCLIGQNYWGNKFYSNVSSLFWNYAPELESYLKDSQ